MARCTQPRSLLLVATALVVAAGVATAADDEKCGSPCGNPCGVPCVYASPPPPEPEYYPPPPPVYYPPPPPEYYPPPPPEYYPPPETPPVTGCPPSPYGGGGGGGYEPTPGYTPGYNPAPSGGGWSPPYTPSYNTPPGTLYPVDPGFRPNDAANHRAAWRAVVFAASSAVAGALLLAL